VGVKHFTPFADPIRLAFRTSGVRPCAPRTGRRKMSREHDAMACYRARHLGSDGWIFTLTLCTLLLSIAAR